MFLAAGLWTILVAAARGGNPYPFLLVLAACGGVLVLTKAAGAMWWAGPACVLITGAIVVALFPHGLLSDRPLSGPFGYTNAKGAFFLQVAVAGLMLAAAAKSAVPRLLGIAAALASGALSVVSGSVAATLLLLLPTAAAMMRRRGGATGRRVWAGLFLGAMVISTTFAIAYRPGRPGLLGQMVTSSLSENRPRLWHEALVMLRESPLLGTGPGRFQELSPTARRDPDVLWAHHEFLQQGAEAGVPGLLLLTSLWGWAFVALGPSDANGRPAELAAAGLSALGIHACVDGILHFPLVPLAAAALVGSGMSRPSSQDPPR
ncbi:MAG: O-antigen ligase family protein [Actinomycetota bacterium]